MLRVTGAWANSDYTALVLSAGGRTGNCNNTSLSRLPMNATRGGYVGGTCQKTYLVWEVLNFFFAHIRRHAMLFVWYVLRNPVSCRCRKSYGQWHACLLFQALKRENPVLSLRRQRPSVSSRPEGSLRIFHWGQLLIVDAFKVSDDRALNPGSDSSPVPKIG